MIDRQRHVSYIFFLALLVTLTTAHADRITLRGTEQPLPSGDVQHIERGQVAFLDEQGRMMRLDAQRIQRIDFDGFPELAAAEDALADGDLDRGLLLMLQAKLNARNETQRLWMHLRLAQEHEARGELIEASGHLAAVIRLDSDSAWRRLEPLDRPMPTDIHAVVEARESIRRARTVTRDAQLRSMLDRMLERVEAVYEEAQDERDAPVRSAIAETISGYSVEHVRDGRLLRPGEQLDSDDTPDEQRAHDADRERPQDRADRRPAADAETLGQEQIEALIENESWDEALAACKAVAASPGNRDLAAFLHQYGRVLLAHDRPRDAALQFMRGAIHHSDSPAAVLCLIETAVVYRDTLNNPEAARRLADRATEKLTDDHPDDVRQRLRELRESLTEE